MLVELQNNSAEENGTEPNLGEFLPGADLHGQDLSMRDLRGANLAGANLRGARLFKTNLHGANLCEANLEGAELTGADLHNANLEGIKASRAGFGLADLQEASLFRADLQEASLAKANLQKADLRCSNLVGARLRETNLCQTDLTEANLQQADISLAKVNGASFRNADLRQVRLRQLNGFKKADWIGVDLRDINFAGAYLLRRHIVDQNYIMEFRQYNRLTGLLYYPWWLTCDCGRSMLRWCLWIGVQSIVFASIYTLGGIDFGDYPTSLSPLYFSVVTLTTLGYGDAVPMTIWGQLVAMAEVTIGYMMLGGLLSIFSNKLARRGD